MVFESKADIYNKIVVYEGFQVYGSILILILYGLRDGIDHNASPPEKTYNVKQ